MMEPNYSESWVSQPDVCRCCLSTRGTWDVTDSYITETGEKEVYSEMLEECYGIKLSLLMQFGPSRMVCALCVGHLRQACNFKKQVLAADEQFQSYCATSRDMPRVFKPVVLKVATPQDKADDSDSSSNKSDDGTIDVLGLTDTAETPVIDRISLQKNRRYHKNTKKIEYDDDDDDSDTPISMLSKKNNVTPSVAGNTGNDGFEFDSVSVASAENMLKEPEEPRVRKKYRLETAAMKLRANIALVLKHSMIIPFIYNNNSQFVCQYCDKIFLLFKDLKNHVKVRHSDITENEIERTIVKPRDLIKADVSDISCRLCGSNYNTIEKLIEHLKGLHSQKFELIPEMKNFHGILGFDLSGAKPRCYICAKEFQFFSFLSGHMNEHDTDYICHICGKRTVSQFRLKLHVERHKPDDFQCNHCDRKFKSASGKNWHMRNKHTNPIVHKCPECPLVFKQYLHRIKHMVDKHKYKKPEFRCKYCLKDFMHSGNLAKHIRCYHFKEDNMKHICGICDKGFVHKWILERHLISHTGRRTFECHDCGKMFAKKFVLTRHVKTHLSNKYKDHPCTLCDAAFVQKGTLKNHMKKKHPWSLVQVN